MTAVHKVPVVTDHGGEPLENQESAQIKKFLEKISHLGEINW